MTVAVEALAALVTHRWRDANFDEATFPDIASTALEESLPATSITPSAVIDWLAAAHSIPHQWRLDQTFGQPPVTIHSDGRLRIDVHYWLDGSTAIHGHDFSGAFRVLSGSSLHACFGFDVEHRVNRTFAVGKAWLLRSELLRRGAIRPIFPDARSVHALCHVERPTVTLVLRTNNRTSDLPEQVIFPPTISYSVSEESPLRTRQVQILGMQMESRLGSPERTARRILSTCDLPTAFAVLLALSSQRGSEPLVESLLSVARRRHGRVVDEFPAAFEQEGRRRRVDALRRRVHSPGARFLLGGLLFLEDRPALEDLVRRSFPGEPSASIDRWSLELLTAENPDLLEDPDVRRVLGDCLKRERPGRTAAAWRHGGPRARALTMELVSQTHLAIRSDALLRPLFTGGDAGLHADGSTAGQA